jgi:hypothetical protein
MPEREQAMLTSYQEDLLLSVHLRDHQNPDDQAKYEGHQSLLALGYYRKILDTTSHLRAAAGRYAYTPLLSDAGEVEVKRILAARRRD